MQQRIQRRIQRSARCIAPIVVFGAGAVACSDGEALQQPPDARAAATDARRDAARDAYLAASDSAASDAAVEPTRYAALPGSRCAPGERIGLVQVSRSLSGEHYLAAYLYDRPNPLVGPPELSDSACAFYQQPPASCGSCPSGETCGHNGVCAPTPRRVNGARVILAAGSERQTFVTKPKSGGIEGQVALPGNAFSLELDLLGLTLTLVETALPEALQGLQGSISGTYDKPTGINARWDKPTNGGTVFTHISINHHVPHATFTECAVPASAGMLRVDQAMLTPLAVSTGLEFQGLEHVRFAAANTTRGCVEIRFSLPRRQLSYR